MEKHICIVLPVYNEQDTIQKLSEDILRTIRNGEIIIVDDSNKKNHEQLVRRIQKIHTVKGQEVTVIRRKTKFGRGSAVLAGFRQGLANTNTTFFVEMDSDLSHDPKELPKFFNSLKADVVIGSRYLPKSRIIDWPKRRLILSKLINYFLQLWLQIGLSDYTNGYRLYTRKAVEFLVRQDFKETGFILLSESAFVLHKAGFAFREIPITFVDRKKGSSSVTAIDLVAALIGAIRIRLRNMGDLNSYKS